MTVKPGVRRYFFGISSLLLGALFLYFSYYNFSREEVQAALVFLVIAVVCGSFFWKFIFRDAVTTLLRIDENGIASNMYDFIFWDNVILMIHSKPNDSSRFVPELSILLVRPVKVKGLIPQIIKIRKNHIRLKLTDVNRKPTEIYDFAKKMLEKYQTKYGSPKRTGDEVIDGVLSRLAELKSKMIEAERLNREPEVRRIFEEAMRVLSSQIRPRKKV